MSEATRKPMDSEGPRAASAAAAPRTEDSEGPPSAAGGSVGDIPAPVPASPAPEEASGVPPVPEKAAPDGAAAPHATAGPAGTSSTAAEVTEDPPESTPSPERDGVSPKEPLTQPSTGSSSTDLSPPDSPHASDDDMDTSPYYEGSCTCTFSLKVCCNICSGCNEFLNSD
uniref:Putative ORF-X n=2 Tax=Gammapolyomavirus anseris TaxID=1891746 RepID=A0A077CZ31_9POLY|nr:putative ORF-X [Goose hemorrhagic polyomavirus]QHD56342.1 putative ORF-X [Gammapolyomavirus anseris]QHD56348.1 putative ORF-X [Gammapolyomavirus anseris]